MYVFSFYVARNVVECIGAAVSNDDVIYLMPDTGM